MLLMKNPRDKRQIYNMSNQIYPENPKFLIEAYIDATMKGYGYIKLDMRQETPEKYRVQTRITPEEKPEYCEYSFSPYIYYPVCRKT